MKNWNDRSNSAPETPFAYEPPTLTDVGDAADVILGLPGGGFDGPDGMTEPDFEFESDGDAE